MNMPHNTQSADGIDIRQLPIRLDRQPTRVVCMPFGVTTYSKLQDLCDRVAQLDEDQVKRTLESVVENFSRRHKRLERSFEEHYGMVASQVGFSDEFSRERRLLLGAYCTMEYSVEGAALFNPSITPHPDQEGTPPGTLRFIMSLRAVGEGHLSSVVFRTGTILENGEVVLDPPGTHSSRMRVKPDISYEKAMFLRKLGEIGTQMENAEAIMRRLPDHFTFAELGQAVGECRNDPAASAALEITIKTVLSLARANYQLELGSGDSISDLVIFPHSDSEARGIEDVRLTRFEDDNHEVTYFGTYTAFDGQNILPMLFETKDFGSISVHTLNGACAQNKGMALFPRRIDGHYAVCSRIDGCNLFLMLSDHVHFWETATLLVGPKYPWEFRLIGNCGSPLWTERGWLLLTHGVGPMRTYCIGATLLDSQDPFRVLGRLKTPLLMPTEEERVGYVPNVVYSCGSLIYNGRLVLPYAVSDTATRMVDMPLEQLLDRTIADGA